MPKGYWKWVKFEADWIKSDGCTKSFEAAHKCCLEHDLAFHYGRDPRHAFICGWELADPIGFRETNARFRGCLPWWLKYRWIAVATAGYPLWRKHRKERP